MDIKNFVLSYYKNSSEDFHIHRVEKSVEAQKPHTHDYFQIYYVISGSLEHFVENESSILLQGNMFIIPPKALHFIAPNENTVFYSFSFMPSFISGKNGAGSLVEGFLKTLQTEKIHPKVLINSENVFYVEGIMEHILREFLEKPIGYKDTVRAYSLVLLTILARNYFETKEDSAKYAFKSNKQFVLHCIDYIEKNYTDDLSLEEMLKHSGMSRGNFCTLFSELTGHSFNSYLNLCRIKKATEYIDRGYKITSIYGLCGYNDFSTFFRNFKKVMGISPNEYRKKK